MCFTLEWLEAQGFVGGISIDELRRGKLAELPAAPGVYVVLRESSTRVGFLEVSPAGHFKGRDPTVSRADLESRWIPDCPSLYIGRSNNLRTRWRTRLRFSS